MKTKGLFYGIPYSIYNHDNGKRKPVLFFFHGLGSDRESGSMGRCEQFADLGYYVVAIDAYCHGERQKASFNELSQSNKQKEVINIAIQTAKDAMFLYRNYLKNMHEIIPYQVSAYGVSLGGTTAFYFATIMDEVNTVVSILGSPSFVDFYQYKQQKYQFEADESYRKNMDLYETIDPIKHYRLLSRKNIFMASGVKDEVVPYIYSHNLKQINLNNHNIIYKQYDTAHVSTHDMIQDSYSFLSDILPFLFK